jgi:hypothetical protein
VIGQDKFGTGFDGDGWDDVPGLAGIVAEIDNVLLAC